MAAVQGVQNGPAASSVMWCVGLGGVGWQQPPVPVHVPARGERAVGSKGVLVLCHLERATRKCLSPSLPLGVIRAPSWGCSRPGWVSP